MGGTLPCKYTTTIPFVISEFQKRGFTVTQGTSIYILRISWE